jgi:hypothetical protein
MKVTKVILAACFALSLSACGGTDGTVPGAPTDVSVAPGVAPGTATVTFTAPTSTGSSQILSYTVTANPGGIVASGTSSPIPMVALNPRTAYTYSVVATNAAGSSAPATTGALRFYTVVETFHEPMTQPNDSIFTGTFTFDTTAGTVSHLTGSLTQSMVGPPMTSVVLANQLSSVPATLGGVNGLLVTTFKLATTNTFDPSGFAPGGTEYYGLSTGAPNPKNGGVGNAYAMIFVNTTDPTVVPGAAQIAKLAYADCTADGMMMNTCMTGTSMMGYGRMGTMMGEPVSQVVTER